MQPCWPVGTFASHLVGFDGKPEAKELFAEITLVEFVTEDGLVGCLQFSKGKVLRKEGIDGVRVGEFCNEAVVGIFNNCCVVIGSRGKESTGKKLTTLCASLGLISRPQPI